MKEEQIKLITDELEGYGDLAKYLLEDFILEEEDILALYTCYEEEKELFFDSLAYILTKKRLLVLEIKKDTCLLKVLHLNDISGLEIDNVNNIPGKVTGLTRADQVRTINISFKNDANNINIEFKDTNKRGKSIEKEKAFKFLMALNK